MSDLRVVIVRVHKPTAASSSPRTRLIGMSLRLDFNELPPGAGGLLVCFGNTQISN